MADLEKVIRGWERCRKCHDVPILFSESYRDCEYTRGMYCRQDILIEDTLALLKQQEAVVRCKDCKHGGCRTQNTDGSIFRVVCKKHSTKRNERWMDADWFCADGEKKE